MRPCAITNLATGGTFVLLTAFAACSSSTLPPEPAQSPDNTEVSVTEPEGEVPDEAPPTDDPPEAEDDEPAEATGSDRSPKDIQEVITKNRQPVRDCYEKALKKLPDLEGDMVITFVIKPMGEVKEASLNVEKSTIRAPAVVDCAIEHLLKVKFTPHPKGMESTVNYPFNFKPGSH